MIRLSHSMKLPDKVHIDEAVQLTGELLTKTLENTPKIVSDITKHLAKTQGKGIRTLVLLNCAMDSESYVSHEAIRATSAIEIFHMATLVHDDVIDDAPLRRGIQSIQNRFGKKQAVICGDYLLCVAFSLVNDIYESYSDVVPDFSKAMARVCLGELNQYKNNSNVDLGIWEYFRIISGKTAALFYLSAYTGAVIGGSDKKEAKNIARYGQYLGMVFQIIDDCKDYEFDESEALKPVKNDLAESVITLPLILAILKEPSLRIASKKALESKEGIADIIKSVCRLGGTEEAKDIAAKYCKKAEKILERLDNPKKREALSVILQKALAASNKF